MLRASWTGYLRLSLITIPVRLSLANCYFVTQPLAIPGLVRMGRCVILSSFSFISSLL
jgi:hypothetical protein